MKPRTQTLAMLKDKSALVQSKNSLRNFWLRILKIVMLASKNRFPMVKIIRVKSKETLTMTLKIGDKAIQFQSIDQNNNVISLSDYAGKNVILYFYPKDNTPGCTLESCAFKEFYARITSQNADVIGVSKDSVPSHQKFATAYDLPFKLVADTTTEVCQAYGVLKDKSMFGKKYKGIERTTFLIDGQGIIKKIWPKVSVANHVAEVLAELEEL
jgi:Peroxiredoxin